MVAPGYVTAMDAFLARVGGTPVGAFHGVRNMPYASRGNRDPAVALGEGEGACTAKHILLRDLLRHLGEAADVETVEGDFAALVPDLPSMPDELRGAGPVRDFHNVTVWRGWRLDATWPDRLAPYGFALNDGWAGEGETPLAVGSPQGRGIAEDAAAHKAALIATMPEAEREHRARYLKNLTAWLDWAQHNETLRRDAS
ncbi:MAG: hypothetical protein AAFW98_13135 [Pseudomonadota bacterium]